MSTGDALLHAAAAIGVRDGVRNVLPGAVGDDRERTWIRAFVVAIGAIAYYFAVVSEVSIVSLLLGAYGGVAQIFPLMFAAFYWPRATGAGALAGLLAGLAVNTLFLLMPELRPLPMHEGVYGILANILVFITVSLRTPPADPEILRTFTEA
jgi:SSS family solute:Na+ symporter